MVRKKLISSRYRRPYQKNNQTGCKEKLFLYQYQYHIRPLVHEFETKNINGIYFRVLPNLRLIQHLKYK